MANFGLGLAQGFQLGTQLGEALRKRRMREESEEAQRDIQRPKYTREQGDFMNREAAMTDEFGRPLYEYTIEPGSTTYNRRELRYAPEEASGMPEMSMAIDRVSPSAPESAGPVDMSRIFAVPSYPTLASMQGRAPIEPFIVDKEGIPAGGLGTPSASVAPAAPAAPSAPSAMTPGLFRGGQTPIDFSRAAGPSDRDKLISALTREYGPLETMTPGATEYLGKTYGAEGLTPAQQRTALLNRYADIISTYEDPVEGEKFRSLARAEERAEQSFELNTQLSKLQIAQVARTDKEANDLDKLSTAATAYRRQNPDATPMDIVNHVTATVNPSAAALNKYVAQVAQVDAAELQLMNSNIDRKIRGKSLTGMIALYNDDPMFDPNTNLVEEKGPKGGVVLKVVDSKDPSKVLETFSFKDPTTARDFLINSAKNPGQQAQWLRTMQLQEAQGRYYTGRADYYEAGGGVGRRQGRDYSAVDAAQRVKALTSIRSEYSRDAERLRDQLEAMRPNDPNREAVIRQLNDTLNEMRQIDVEMRGYRTGGGGGGLRRDGGGEPERYESGKVYSFRDEKGNVKDYRLKEGKTGAAPEDWEEAKGAPAPKAEAEAKAAPAKEEPPKKDTTKYIREKSPRSGTFIYTESPRGLTKEQWAQLDEDKKKK